MIKHLLISIPLLLAACGEWKPCCETGPGTYCLADECSAAWDNGDPGDGEGEGDDCEVEGLTTYYTWIVTEDCKVLGPLEICSSDPDTATASADASWPGMHGPVSTDPNANQPPLRQSCASGSSCTVGASDGSLASQFWVFTDEQLHACEQWLDSQCTWQEADQTTGACPPAAP